MNLKEIKRELTKREGKKSEVKVGDMAEVLGQLSEMMALDDSVIKALVLNGQRRLKKKIKALL
jgi:SOS response regulatory protein OraA/RecX